MEDYKNLFEGLGIASFIISIICFVFQSVSIVFTIFAFVFLLLFIVFFILYLKYKIKLRNLLERKDEEYLNKGYKKCYDGINERILVDENNKSVVYLNIHEIEKVMKYSDILKCELLDSGTTVSTISKSHASLGKAIVGGALFGPVGAIVGGVNGTTISNSNTISNKLEIKITTNNIDDPAIFVILFKKQLSTNSKEYNEYYTEAQKLLSIFEVILNNK